MSISLVCIIGIGTVFVGLVFLIAISYIMSYVCQMFAKPESNKPSAQSIKTPAKNAVPIANKQELVAGICAAIAEELGTDVSNIRVNSFKKL